MVLKSSHGVGSYNAAALTSKAFAIRNIMETFGFLAPFSYF